MYRNCHFGAMEKELKEGEQDEAQDEPMEEEEVIETVEIDQSMLKINALL